MGSKTRVYLEQGSKRAFAGAADWPGWCRGAKTEESALEALAAYGPRYARVAHLAGLDLPAASTGFEVVERIPGNATTEFGAPGVPAKDESRKLTSTEARRMLQLLEACWNYLDQVVAKAPASLRKGPRGGGRDRDAMFDHVLGAEAMYARAAGVRLKQPDGRDAKAVRAFRQGILEGLAHPDPAAKWPAAYAVRRTAWHALDHAWEIEDRIP